MPRKLPKGCVEDRDRHGNVRIYYRAKGRPKVRLHGLPFTEPFMEAYRQAARGPEPQAEPVKPASASVPAAEGTSALALRPLFRRARVPR